MKRALVLFGLVVVVFALVTDQRSAAAPKPVDELINAANRQYERYFNAPRVEAASLAAQFSSDAVLLIPEVELISSREAIQESIAQTAGQMSNVKLRTTRVKASGNLAYELGTWSSTIDARPTIGNYMTVWREEGGKWLRAAGCSVPVNGANPLLFRAPGRVFGTNNVTATETQQVRLVGDRSVWETGPKLRALSNDYAQVLNGDDRQAVRRFAMNLYTPDAFLMIPEAELMETNSEIAEACEATVGMDVVTNLVFDVKWIEAGTSGDIAVELAGYRNDVRSEKGEIVPTAGYYLAVWVRSGTQWKIAGSCTSNVSPTPDINYGMKG